MRIQPQAWELNALILIDSTWLSVMHEKGSPFEELEDTERIERPTIEGRVSG